MPSDISVASEYVSPILTRGWLGRVLQVRPLIPANTSARSNGAPRLRCGTLTTVIFDRIQHAEDDHPPLAAGIA